jgi:hypothetical protein
MSSLWHDPDLDAPVKRFETPLVHKNFDEMPLPAEHVELPDGVADPFAKQDAAYDAAAAQEERGRIGFSFLNGTKGPALTSPAAPSTGVVAGHAHVDAPPTAPGDRRLPAAEDAVRSARWRSDEGAPTPVAKQQQQLERDHHRGVDAAAHAYQPGRSSTQTKTAAAAEAEKVARQGAVDSLAPLAASFAPMAAAQAATTAVQGPLPALAAAAAPALEVAGAVASAGQLTLTGVAEGLKDTAPEAPRRGLRRS